MKQLSFLMILFGIFLMACGVRNEPSEQAEQAASSCSDCWYPQTKEDTIVQNRLIEDARWRLYCLQGMEPVQWFASQRYYGLAKTYGELSLEFHETHACQFANSFSLMIYFKIYDKNFNNYAVGFRQEIPTNYKTSILPVYIVDYSYKAREMISTIIPEDIVYMYEPTKGIVPTMDSDNVQLKMYRKSQSLLLRLHARANFLINADFRQYLEQNSEKINPWFREEAIRRGLLERKGSVN